MRNKTAMRVVLFATVMAPFTALRFGFFGVAEVVIGMLFLQQASRGIKVRRMRQFPLTTFWAFYVIMCAIGANVNELLVRDATGTLRGMAFDWASYIFLLLACFTLERLASHEGFDPSTLVRGVFLWASSVLSLLYGLSLFTPEILGLRLKYHQYFSPLATNLHQVSMFLVPLPFLGVLVLRRELRPSRKLLAAALIGMDVLMSFHTGSTKASMGIVLGVAVLGYAYSLKVMRRPYFLLVNALYLGAVLLVGLKINYMAVASDFFVANDLRGGRQSLYTHAMMVSRESYLFGLGPGGHLTQGGDAFWDAHSTLLTVLLQTGMIGLIGFAAVFIRIGRRAVTDPALLAAFTAVLIYALGGDILRRLPIWILLFAIAHFPVTSPGLQPAAEQGRCSAGGRRRALRRVPEPSVPR